MPRATLEVTEVRKELKTCPGGYVVIRRMNYGEKLHKSEMTMKMRMDMADKKNMGADMEMLTRKVAVWSFANMIVDHNLEDDKGVKLNFKNPANVDALDGRIGEEIDTYIDELNNFEDDEELGNSDGGSTPPSS